MRSPALGRDRSWRGACLTTDQSPIVQDGGVFVELCWVGARCRMFYACCTMLVNAGGGEVAKNAEMMCHEA